MLLCFLSRKHSKDPIVGIILAITYVATDKMDKILMDNRGKGNKILTFVHSCTKFSIAYVDKKIMDSHV